MGNKITENEIDLLNILNNIWKSKFQILFILLIFTFSAYLVGNLIPKNYKVKLSITSKNITATRAFDTEVDITYLNDISNMLTSIFSDIDYFEDYINNHPDYINQKKNNKNFKYKVIFKSGNKPNKSTSLIVLDIENEDQSVVIENIMNDFTDEVFNRAIKNVIRQQNAKIKKSLTILSDDLEIAEMLNIKKDVSVDINREFYKESNAVINFTTLQGYHKGTLVLEKQIETLEKRYDNFKKNLENSVLYNKSYFFEKVQKSSKSIFALNNILLLFIAIGILVSTVFVVLSSKKTKKR